MSSEPNHLTRLLQIVPSALARTHKTSPKVHLKKFFTNKSKYPAQMCTDLVKEKGYYIVLQ